MFTFILLIVNGCGGDNIPQPGSELRDFESVWQAADTYYAHFELKGIDWDEVHQRLLPRAQQAKGHDIDTVLIDLLAELKDQHVWFQAAGEKVEPYRTVRSARDDGAFSLEVVEAVIGGSLQSAAKGMLRYGMLEGNIGYIYFTNFNKNVKSAFFDALESLQNSDGLIVDIRHNRGGSLDALKAIVSRFTTTRFPGLPAYYLGKHEPSLTATIVPRRSFHYTKRVVLLINGVTVSAGESFSVMMKRFPSVTAIGDTTAGGGACFITNVRHDGIIQMSSGRSAWIPTVDLRQYDGTPVEWLGVPPDIRVAQTMVDIENNIDKQLEFATEFLQSN